MKKLSFLQLEKEMKEANSLITETTLLKSIEGGKNSFSQNAIGFITTSPFNFNETTIVNDASMEHTKETNSESMISTNIMNNFMPSTTAPPPPSPYLAAFNINGLSQTEIDNFNRYLMDMDTATSGHKLLEDLLNNTSQYSLITISHATPTGGANGIYDPLSKTITLGENLSSPDMSESYVLDNLAHEMFHSYQDIKGVTQGAGAEPDAYIFGSLFDRQYGMADAFINESENGINPTTANTNYNSAFDGFFNNNYDQPDYDNIYNYFLSGSQAGGQYSSTLPLNSSQGDSLIYEFL